MISLLELTGQIAVTISILKPSVITLSKFK
jgi:hypothetical protein